jgi:hypothetical protein
MEEKKIYKTSEELDKIITKEYLIENLLVKEIFRAEVARMVGCGPTTIKSYEKKFNISVPKLTKLQRILTKEFIIENCVNKGMFPEELAKNVNCEKSIIYRKIRKFGINLDKWGKLLTKEFLEARAIDSVIRGKVIPCRKIAKEVGCDPGTVRKKASELGLVPANISETKMGIKASEETKEKIGKAHKGKKLVFSNKEEWKRKIGVKAKLRFSNPKNREYLKSPERLHKILKSIQASPNSFELKCLEHLNKIYNNSFKYVGDGSLIISGRSADAYSEELNIVCLFHGTYWHLKKYGLEITEENKRSVEKVDSLPFLSAGYRVIFIWEDELSKIVEYKC